MEEWIFEEGYPTSAKTPSRRDGLSADEEGRLRVSSVKFIELLAKDLRLNRLVVSTACVLFHRFFAFQSFKQHNRLVSGGYDLALLLSRGGDSGCQNMLIAIPPHHFLLLTPFPR